MQVTARVAGHKCSLEDRSPWIALRKINNTSPNKCLGRVLDRRHLKVYILITVTSSTKIVICFGIFHSVSWYIYVYMSTCRLSRNPYPSFKSQPWTWHWRRWNMQTELSLTFQVSGWIQQVRIGGESNSQRFLLVLFFFSFSLKVAGGHIHSRWGKSPAPAS